MSRKAPQVHPDAHSPEAALRKMREAVAAARYVTHPRVLGRLPELGLAPGEVREALEAALGEVTLEDYKAPDHAFNPPGHGFVWQSRRFGCRMYLKFRLEGKKPVCCLYSLHKDDY